MFPALYVKKLYFCLFDLEIDFVTLKMTLSQKNNTRHGLPSQNHENEVLHFFLASFDENSYLTLNYLAAILFLPLKIPPRGTRLISAGNIP